MLLLISPTLNCFFHVKLKGDELKSQALWHWFVLDLSQQRIELFYVKNILKKVTKITKMLAGGEMADKNGWPTGPDIQEFKRVQYVTGSNDGY